MRIGLDVCRPYVKMQQQQSRQRKLLREGTYVIQLANGEQHYVQASAMPQQYQHIQLQQPQQIHMQAASTQQHPPPAPQPQHQHQQQQQQQPQQQIVTQPDTFQEVITFVHQLYRELSKEKHLSHYNCLFCAHEYVDMKSLIRHITDMHRIHILDGTINLEQDFEDIIRSKILAREEKAAMQADNQLYQCVQCQQMFNSLAVITEHLNYCTPPQEPVEAVYDVKQEMAEIEVVRATQHHTQQQVHATPPQPQLVVPQEVYIPYGCARCGSRYHTIRELTRHLIACTTETIWGAEKHLLPEYRVDAPDNQHIVINEDTTNVTLKTTGLWLMQSSELDEVGEGLRGFWADPSATSIFGDVQETPPPPPPSLPPPSLPVAQPMPVISSMVPLHAAPAQAAVKQNVMLTNAVQLQQQQQPPPQAHQQHAAPGTLIVLPGDAQQLMATDALSCIQTTDGQYHVINANVGQPHIQHHPQHQQTHRGRVDNQRTVITHAPATEPMPASHQIAAAPVPTAPVVQAPQRNKRRGRTTTTTTTTKNNNYTSVVVSENTAYVASPPVVVDTPLPSTSAAKRKRGPMYVQQPQQEVIQATMVPESGAEAQQLLFYDQNGLLVPVENLDSLATDGAIADMNFVNIDEQYILQNLHDVSGSMQQPASPALPQQHILQAQELAPMQHVHSPRQLQQAPHPSIPPSPATSKSMCDAISNNGASSSTSTDATYNVDDLSHLDTPIPGKSAAVLPAKAKPQFMDSFFSFLMNRETNKL